MERQVAVQDLRRGTECVQIGRISQMSRHPECAEWSNEMRAEVAARRAKQLTETEKRRGRLLETRDDRLLHAALRSVLRPSGTDDRGRSR